MPRIGQGGGGGGPIITPQTETQQTQQTHQTDFASKVAAQTQGTDAARTQTAKATQQSQLTGKTREIAKRMHSGELTQREATREFVGLVIEERFPHFKKRKQKKKKKKGDGAEAADPSDVETLEESVTELIDRDPVLAKQLAEQFKRLATKE